MYHIPNDKRAEKSANALFMGLSELLEKKNFDEISVTDIWKISGVSRATFYRLFDNTMDILSYGCSKILLQVTENLSYKKNRSFEEINLTLIDFCLKNSTSIEMIMKAHRMDIFYQARTSLFDLYHPCFESKNIPKYQEESILLSICALLPAFFELWLQSDRTMTASDLNALLSNSLIGLSRMVE